MPNQILTWLFQFQTLFGALIGAGAAFLIEHLRRRRRILTYEVVSIMPVFAKPAEFREKISVAFEGTPIDSLYTCRVILRNRGNEPLERQAVLFEFNDTARILEVNLTTRPEREFGAIELDGSVKEGWRRRYIFALLNPKDTVTVDFTIAGEVSEIYVAAKSKGLEFLSEDRFVLPRLIRLGLGLLGVIVIIGALFLQPFYLTIVTALVLAFLARVWTWWWGEVNKPFKKQMMELSGETPLQILLSAWRSLVTGVLIIATTVVLVYRYPEEAYRAVAALFNWMIRVLQGIVSGLE